MKREMKKSAGKLSGTPMANALFLARMVSKKNRNARQRKAIIDTMDRSQMNQFGQVMKKFMKSDYKMPRKDLNRLKKDRAFVSALMDSRVPLETKKKILRQKGGFLGILPAVLKTVAAPILGSIASKLF